MDLQSGAAIATIIGTIVTISIILLSEHNRKYVTRILILVKRKNVKKSMKVQNIQFKEFLKLY